MESTNQLEGVRIPLIILLQDKGDAFEVFATSRFGLDSTLQNAVGRLAVEGVKSGEVRDGLGRKWAWSAGRQFAAGQGVGLQGELVLQSGENGVHRSDGHPLLELAAWISNQLQHDANNLATAVLGVATILELKLPKNEENGTQIGRLHRACESYRAKVEQFRVFQETERSNGCTSASVIERWCLEKPGVRLESGSTTRAQQDWRLPCSAGLFRFLLDVSLSRVVSLCSDGGTSPAIRVFWKDESPEHLELHMQAMSEPLSEKVQGTVAHPAFPRAEEEMLLGYALHRMSHFGVTNRWAEDGVVWSFPMDANPTESRNGRFPTSQRIVAAVGCSFQVAEGLLQVAKDARIELIPVNYPSAALALRGVAGNADFSVVIGPESAEAILEGGNAWKPLLEAPIALTVLVDEKGEVPFPDDGRWRVVKTGDISSLSVDEARAALGIDIVGQNQ